MLGQLRALHQLTHLALLILYLGQDIKACGRVQGHRVRVIREDFVGRLFRDNSRAYLKVLQEVEEVPLASLEDRRVCLYGAALELVFKVNVVNVKKHFADVPQQNADQLVKLKDCSCALRLYRLLGPVELLHVVLCRHSRTWIEAHGLALLLPDDSGCKWEHMEIHQSFQAKAGVLSLELGLCHLHQGLQEVLKVHVGLAPVDRAEY